MYLLAQMRLRSGLDLPQAQLGWSTGPQDLGAKTERQKQDTNGDNNRKNKS